MRIFRLFVAAAIFGITISSVAADPAKYRLNAGEARVGDTIHAEGRVTMNSSEFNVAAGGQTIPGRMNVTANTATTTTTQTVAGGRATTLEVAHEKEASSMNVSMAGQDIPHEEASPMEGATVVRKRTAAGWTDSLKSGTPTARQKKYLRTNQPDDAELLYPAGEVAIGETWSVPPTALQRLFGDEVRDVTGMVRCQLMRVETFEGETCAVVGVDLSGTGHAMDKAAAGMRVAVVLHGTIHRVLRRPVDLKVELSGNLKMSGDVATGGVAASLNVSGPLTVTERTTIVK